MWYGSLVRRHGRSRPCLRYQARSARRKRCRVLGGGSEAADIRTYNFTRRTGGPTRSGFLNERDVKIYTKTGDSGETSLFDNTRVSKGDTRVDAYGEVDEVNACLGAARAAGMDDDMASLVESLQKDLFALGARLADPSARIAPRVEKAVIGDAAVENDRQSGMRDLETILETCGDYSSRTHDADVLTEYARVALARAICRQWVDENDHLPCLMLEAGLEELIAGHVEQADNAGGAINTMPPGTQQRIGHLIAGHATALAHDGRPPVVLCAPQVRACVRKLIEPVAPQVAVLSLAEVVADVTPDVIGVVADQENVEPLEQSGAGDGGEAGLGDRVGVSGLVEDRYESSNV